MLTIGHLNYINALPFYAGFLSRAIPCEIIPIQAQDLAFGQRESSRGSTIASRFMFLTLTDLRSSNPGALASPKCQILSLNGYKWVSGVPSTLNGLLEKGELDISLISSYEYLKNQDKYILLPDHCIAAYDRVMSVSLYIRGSLADLNGRLVGLTSHSATSSRLVQMLCATYWKVSPQFKIVTDHEPLTDYEGFLLIGNRALLNLEIPGYQMIDLATVWHEMTGLPLPFAVLAARRSVWEERRDEVDLFLEKLDASLQWSRGHSGFILDHAEKACPVSREVLQEYFSLLRYTFGPEEKQGLKRYEKLCFIDP